MNRSILVSLVALPLLAACSGNGGGGSGGEATGGAAPDAGVVTDAGADADAAPEVCALVKPYSTQDTDCNACAEAECCAEVNACLLDPGCDDGYVNCAIACALEADAGTDPACLAECANQFPEGAMEYDAAIGCVESACATPCE